MKVHIDKKQNMERAGLLKKVQVWEIYAWYELNDEERTLLEANPDVKKIEVMDYEYKGVTDIGPSVGYLTAPECATKGGRRFVAYSSGAMMNYVNALNDGAKQLKDHLMSLKGAEGSSVTEI